jgi:hypothetical protein
MKKMIIGKKTKVMDSNSSFASDHQASSASEMAADELNLLGATPVTKYKNRRKLMNERLLSRN